MSRREFFFLLLTSLSLLSESSLMAMEDPNAGLYMHSRAPTKLSVLRESMEETIDEIDCILKSNIEYNKDKKNILKEILDSLASNNYKKFITDYKNFFGEDLLDENINVKELRYRLDGLQQGIYTYEIIIYNATTFRRDLYHNINKEYKYPRNHVGAGLISAAASIEQQENARYHKPLLEKRDVVSKYILETICMEEMEFWNIIQEDIKMHYLLQYESHPKEFDSECRAHNDAYKLKEGGENKSSIKPKKYEFEGSVINNFIKWKLKKLTEKNKKRDGFPSSIPAEWTQHLKDSKVPSKTAKKGKMSKGKSAAIEKHSAQKAPQTVNPTEPSWLAVLENEAKDEVQIEAISDKDMVSKAITVEPVRVINVDLPPPSPANVDIEEDITLLRYQPYVKTVAEMESLSPPKIQPYMIEAVNKKYQHLLKSIFLKGKNIDFGDVKSMMLYVFKAHVSSFKSGTCHFDLYLLHKTGEPTQFVNKETYLKYQKESKSKTLDHTVVRRTIVSEPPHSRGSHKQGQTRFMYPALVELLASSLERSGLTPKNLGWE
ncbi:MAG: hypothetical protein K2P93_00615 [Alphaproteobacteria bacterium]|nr:hypothetical protein [Alphaproteobacteria bacterium]